MTDLDMAVDYLFSLSHYGLGVAGLNLASTTFLGVDFVGQLAAEVPYFLEFTALGAAVGSLKELAMEDEGYLSMIGV